MNIMMTRREMVGLSTILSLSTLASCSVQTNSNSIQEVEHNSTENDSIELLSEVTINDGQTDKESSTGHSSGIITYRSLGSEIEIGVIDPTNGEETPRFRVFDLKADGNSLYSAYCTETYFFYEDFSKIAASYNDGTNSHVGWIDQDGSFFDLTAALLPPQGDFGGKVYWHSPVFSQIGYFYWRNDINDTVCRVPLNNMNESAIEEMAAVGPTVRWFVASDGSVSNDICSPQMTNRLTHLDIKEYGSFAGWIDESHFLTEDGGIHVFNDGVVEFVNNPIPIVSGRKSFNAIPSPDGTQVAFLSYLENEGAAGLYVTQLSMDGTTEPVKIAEGYATKAGTGNGSSLGAHLLCWV